MANHEVGAPGAARAPAFAPLFPQGGHRLLAPLRANHFWFEHRRRRILETAAECLQGVARPRVLELGCGDGDLLSAFAERFWSVGLERNVDDLAAARRISPLNVVAGEGGAPPFSLPFDLVGLFDVVEHVEDDAGLLRLASRLASPGAWILVTVPADPRLWTNLDVYAGHFRRYRREDLERLFERAKLELQRIVPLFRVLWPLARVKAALLGRRPIADPQAEYRVAPLANRLLSAGLSLESALYGASESGLGTSWLAVARTRPEAT